jgi:DNA-binding NtrC family response regulator
LTAALRVLVVDDDPGMSSTLADILRAKGYAAETAASSTDALSCVGDRSYDCVLSDIRMPGMDGVELYREIRQIRPEMQVVLMTAYTTDSRVREGLDEGVLAVLDKPLDIDKVLGFLSALQRQPSVTIVDDDDLFRITLGDVLKERGFATASIEDPYVVAEQLQGDGEVLVLDMKLNSITGLDVLRQVRDRYPHLPVILVTGYGREMASVIEQAVQLNSCMCLYKPFPMPELFEALDAIRRQELAAILGRPPEAWN